jgi:hypothetical protein
MATIDYRRIADEKARQEAFDELMEFLETEDGKKALPNWVDLMRYLNDKEVKIKEQDKVIKEYRDFFSTLSSLLPRQFSIHDRLI